MDLMYFDRKKHVPKDYKRPVIVPSGSFSGMLLAGEVIVGEPTEAQDLSEIGSFGNFLQRREPIVSPQCFGVQLETLIAMNNTEKVRDAKRAKFDFGRKFVRLGALEKAGLRRSAEANKCLSAGFISDSQDREETTDANLVFDQKPEESTSQSLEQLTTEQDGDESQEKLEGVGREYLENVFEQHSAEENWEKSQVASRKRKKSESGSWESAKEMGRVNESNVKKMERWASLQCGDRRLRLGMEEAMYLACDLDVLRVSSPKMKSLTVNELWSHFFAIAGVAFVKRYACYRRFRELGWVVRSGLICGADFMLYCDGPDYHHASAAVRIVDDNEDARMFAVLNRGLNNMKKSLLQVLVDIPMGLKIDKDVTCIEAITVSYINLAACQVQYLQDVE